MSLHYAPPARPEDIIHFGTLGMKWGVRNGPPYPLDQHAYSSKSPRIEDGNSYIYKKGTIVGRFGDYSVNDPVYLFTNESDRKVYQKGYGKNEYKFKLVKNLKIPNVVEAVTQLYNYTKDPEVLNNPYYYWKDTINLGLGGEIHDGFIKYMKKKGYDGLPDVRNAGSVSEDPIYVFQPKKFLKKLKI